MNDNDDKLIVHGSDKQTPIPLEKRVYVPTLEDLHNIFSRLPDANKVKADEFKIPLEIIAEIPMPASRNSMMEWNTVMTKKETVAYLTFKKLAQIDKNKNIVKIWVYEGIVKFKD